MTRAAKAMDGALDKISELLAENETLKSAIRAANARYENWDDPEATGVQVATDMYIELAVTGVGTDEA